MSKNCIVDLHSFSVVHFSFQNSWMAFVMAILHSCLHGIHCNNYCAQGKLNLVSQQMTFACYVKVTRKIQNISYWYVHPLRMWEKNICQYSLHTSPTTLDQILSIELTRTHFVVFGSIVIKMFSNQITGSLFTKIIYNRDQVSNAARLVCRP
jgi:hypothetical protein